MLREGDSRRGINVTFGRRMALQDVPVPCTLPTAVWKLETLGVDCLVGNASE